MRTRIAINGFGRIGRNVLRAMGRMKIDDLEIVAVNDLTDTRTLAHLLTWDSVHGRFDGTVEPTAEGLVVNGHVIKVLSERDPSALPWRDLKVDLVLESTGRFTDRLGASKHLEAGASRVIISAPAKQEDVTVVFGVNQGDFNPARHRIISNASCTTNCLAPMVKIVHEQFGFVKGFMTTVHSYTNDQNILDLPHKDLRRARAAMLSIIPTTTGAAKATALVIPEVKGRLDGVALRVPTADVSFVDLTCEVRRPASIDEVNAAFRSAAATGPLSDVLAVSDLPLVSCDYIGDLHSCTMDLLSTNVLEGTMVHVSGWYDNEMGYSARCVDLLRYIASRG